MKNSRILSTLAVLSLFVSAARAADPAPSEPVSLEGLPQGYVNVMDYITKAGNKTDHTEGIRMAFKDTSRGRAPNGVGGRHFAVLFPPGQYTISDTIEIDFAKVVGNGATIIQTNPEKDIFLATKHFVSVEGISFRGGRDQIHVETGKGHAGNLWHVNKCHFADANGRAMFFEGNMIHVIVEHGTVKGCKNGIMYAGGDSFVIRDFHGNTMSQTNATAFDLRSGIFVMADCLWTPQAVHPDARWIDNRCAMLFIHHTHFGGESGGFTPIVNYAKPGGTIINLESCCFYAQSNLGKKTVVYCEEVPEVIRIIACQIGGIEPIMVSPKIDLKNYFVQRGRPVRPSYRIEDCTGYLGGIPEGLENPVVRREETPYLDDGKVKNFMDEAVKRVAEMTATDGSGKPEECAEKIGKAKRIEPTDTSKCVMASFSNCVMEGPADAENTPNANFFAIRPVGDDLIIMKRQFDTSAAWVLLKGFTVDLDKHPILTRKIRDAGSYRLKPMFPPIRVIDRATGQMTLFGSGYERYSAIDLRKIFGGGVHTFDLRLYWAAQIHLALYDVKKAKEALGADYETVVQECPGHNLPLGAYMVYDYIRAEEACNER